MFHVNDDLGLDVNMPKVLDGLNLVMAVDSSEKRKRWRTKSFVCTNNLMMIIVSRCFPIAFQGVTSNVQRVAMSLYNKCSKKGQVREMQ